MNKYRHGDVLIKRINDINGKFKQDKGDVVVALGEVTGHSHRFKSDNGKVELYEDDNGQLFVKVLSEEATITHEEHGPVVVPKGNYSITIQREYEPEGWRSVAD
jgi:hypothetical protein